MSNILEKIVAHKKTEIAGLDGRALRNAAEDSPAPRDFLSAIKHRSHPGPSLIAELKRASPSKGILASDLDLFQLAKICAENGASALSVLTDEKFFMGKLETLQELRFGYKSELPLLRKDFIIDEVQLYESRATGADAVLLIVAALPDDQHLADLHALTLQLGLAALVEVHNEAEIERALKLQGVLLIGINNRDLATFDVSLATTERLRPLIPPEIVLVAESGIFIAGDVERLAHAHVDAILVGEALVTAEDIPAKVRELSGWHEPSELFQKDKINP
ncbi:MAG TPA: indole-3-glycerol phosphate synthase TrpC [Anaerolineales bacterium]|nr:indole-3-glycerol phosphate synthase TrpC [Anaerolineales bacterium]